jgi:hypothetical protein
MPEHDEDEAQKQIDEASLTLWNMRAERLSQGKTRGQIGTDSRIDLVNLWLVEKTEGNDERRAPPARPPQLNLICVKF